MEDRQLPPAEEILDRLWGALSSDETERIAREEPDLVELCRINHARHRHTREESP